MTRALVALALVGAVGCKRSAKEALTGAAPADMATATRKAAKPGDKREDVKRQALALLRTWVDAQNRGDATAYFALYDAAHFKGVKRTPTTGAVKLDFAGWKADRAKMLKARPRVAADAAEVTTWLDPGTKLKRGAVEIHFIQRWQSAKFADHGEKVLALWRDGSGALHIEYEDLVNSEAGWDAAPLPAFDVAAAEDDEAARAAWKKIAPTGADYDDKLLALPDDPAVRRPLARVLLRDGNFECKEVEELEACGDVSVEWKSIDPKAGLEDPCLRRKLGVWALRAGGLTPADAAALQPALVDLVQMAEPEEDLPKAALALPASDEVKLALFVAAANSGRRALVEEACCGGLAAPSIARLYEEHHLNAAAAALDFATQRKLVLAALADDKLELSTRQGLLGDIGDKPGKDVSEALVALAEGDDDCDLAMDAALALAARGDASRLPKRPAGEDERAFDRALCMLARDPDGERRMARFLEFLPPRGRVRITHHVDNEFAERDEDGNRIDEDDPPRSITRKTAGADDLPRAYGKPDGNTRWEITFKRVGGKLYIEEIHTLTEIYCPC